MTDVIFEGGRGGSARTTVCLTLFNYGAYLPQCLDSVAAQEIEGLDLVVIDDRSTDDSLDVALAWATGSASRFRRVRLCRQPVNGGLAAARNAASALADTEFVFVLDADNELFPHCIGRLQAALDLTTAAFAYGYHQLFGAGRGLANTVAWSADLTSGNKVDAMVLLRRDVLQQAGGFSIMPIMGWEDYDLWFKLARLGHWGVLVPEIVARYRVHPRSMLHTVTNPGADRLSAHLRETYPEFFTEPKEVRFDPVGADRRTLVKRPG